jgi:hypothetical protein
LTAGRGKRILKTGDWFLLPAAGLLVVFLFHHYLFSASSGKEVEITGGSSSARYDLGADRTVLVEGPMGKTRVVIGGGQVWVDESPCRDKICVQMGKKRRAGEQIICLPNRVVVEVIGDELEFDAVSR